MADLPAPIQILSERMSRAEQLILAALDKGPLFFERHAGCGWYFPTPHSSGRFAAHVRKRRFRTMDVRRVIASGLAVQIENQLVKTSAISGTFAEAAE